MRARQGVLAACEPVQTVFLPARSVPCALTYRPSFEQIIGDLTRMRAKLMGAAAGAGAHSSIGSSTLGGASASTTANQFGVHPSGTLGGGATASGMSPALPLVPVTPLQQYQQGGATAVSMTLGGSDSESPRGGTSWLACAGCVGRAGVSTNLQRCFPRPRARECDSARGGGGRPQAAVAPGGPYQWTVAAGLPSRT